MNVLVNEDSLRDIADAIRDKLSVSSTYKPSQMASAIETISGGDIKGLVERTITSISDSTITTVGGYAFCLCSTLESVNLPNVTLINTSGFANCASLSYISFPNLISVGSNAFNHCSSLKSASLPNLRYAQSDAFAYCGFEYLDLPQLINLGSNALAVCSSLSSVSLPRVVWAGPSPFAQCFNLTEIDLPNCFVIDGGYTFQNCWSLSVVNLPKLDTATNIHMFFSCSALTTIKMAAVSSVNSVMFSGSTFANVSTVGFGKVTELPSGFFADCPSLAAVEMPKLSPVQNSVFSGHSYLGTVILGDCSNIVAYAFRSCFRLLSLYISGSSVCSLAATSAFISTPISTYTTYTGGVRGKIYVPESLVDTYKTTARWSTFASLIEAIPSDMQYIL